jgi:hypothetical protein
MWAIRMSPRLIPSHPDNDGRFVQGCSIVDIERETRHLEAHLGDRRECLGIVLRCGGPIPTGRHPRGLFHRFCAAGDLGLEMRNIRVTENPIDTPVRPITAGTCLAPWSSTSNKSECVLMSARRKGCDPTNAWSQRSWQGYDDLSAFGGGHDRSRHRTHPASARLLSVPADGRSSTWCTSTGPSPQPLPGQGIATVMQLNVS